MKIVMLTFAIIYLTTCTSEASWYVIDVHNKAIVKCEYELDTKDLRSRNEFAVFTNQDIPFSEAEYRNGKIIRRTETASEILEEKKKNEGAEEILINERNQSLGHK